MTQNLNRLCFLFFVIVFCFVFLFLFSMYLKNLIVSDEEQIIHLIRSQIAQTFSLFFLFLCRKKIMRLCLNCNISEMALIFPR